MKLVERWHALDSSWKFALGAFLIARVALSAWSLVVFLLFPTVLQNLDLFGLPVLAVFDLGSGERYAYSREVDGMALSFRDSGSGIVTDTQTQSSWRLRDGVAISGKYAGRTLAAPLYPVEEIFPYRGVALETNPVLSLWQRFDTNWYLKIAQRGYSGEDGSTVYFPLYPLLIRLVSSIVGSPMFAALLVSNLALVGALALLYRLTIESFDGSSARRAAAYLLLFPTGFFLLAAYTESLFLLFSLAAFFFARKDQWLVAALCAVLAALTRLQGVLLIIPLAYLLWREAGFKVQVPSFKFQVSGFRFHVLRVVALLLIPFATIAFLAFTNLSFLASYEGELHARFVAPWDNLAAAVVLLTSGQASFVDALNLLATLGFGVMLFAVWKILPREYALYALAMFLAPLFRMTITQPLVSMDRYVLALFPVFMLWGAWGKHPWANRAVVYLSFPLQLYLSAQFVLWGWVG